MSMIDSFKPKRYRADRDRDLTVPADPALPAPLPVAPIARAARAHSDYAEEAKRAAQRYIDQVAQIEALGADLEVWRSRALVAEGTIDQLRAREADLLAQIEKKSAELSREADSYKQTLAVISTQYATAAKILLDGFEAMNQLDALKAAPKLNMPAFAAAIDPHPNDPVDPVDPLAVAPAETEDSA